ncbi:hypothetical protein F4810DRAFT_726824 [Camillea tinctor]|nr:hypothetical protein F4810DRAFT_726824 [Camillea tinctor]
MDHLILPESPRQPVFRKKIALLSAEEYDEGDFSTYPDRQGWGKRPVAEWLNIFRASPLSFASFLERWLLFGTVSTFYSIHQVKAKSSGFIGFTNSVDGAKRPIITTCHFASVLQYIKDGIEPKDVEMRRFTDLLSGGILHVNLSHPVVDTDEAIMYDTQERSLHEFIRWHKKSYRDPRRPGIVMATSIILENLFQILQTFNPMTLGGVSSWDGNGLMWRKLRQEGWCPSDLSRLFQQFNTSALYFILHLPRPRPDEVHHVIRVWKEGKLITGPPTTSSPAQLCTPFKCAHRQLLDADYRTKHADGCNGCDDIPANLDKLCEILERGNIPLILTMDKTDENSEILFHESDPNVDDVPYVAISHVWSDGLGNLDRNSLPCCQLLRLSDMVRDIPGDDSDTLLFWCDTICVPPDSAKRPKAQNLALGQMHNVYKRANGVLVLDSWLLNNSCKDKSDTENLIKIFTCTWNTRLWTYQEGALPRSLHFQFRDGAYDLDRGMKKANEGKDVTETVTLLRPIRQRYHSLRDFRNKEAMVDKLLSVASELSYRSTSVAEDEPLCLAVLLDLDASMIARAEPHLRMERLWGMLSEVPRDFAYTHLKTMDIDGFRWAPKTFLKSPSNMSDNGTPLSWSGGAVYNSARRTQHGISFKEMGILFPGDGRRYGGSLYLRDQHNRWHLLEFLGNTKMLDHEQIDLGDCAEFKELALVPNNVSQGFDTMNYVYT